MTHAASFNSVQKVCGILRALGAGAPARLTDIAEAASVNKVTALRILETLMAEGFVQRSAQDKTYRLGTEAMVMAAGLSGAGDLAALAQPSLLRLAAAAGDTALLSVRSGTEAVYIAREVGDFPLQPNKLQVGSRRPLGAGAGSLALLAALPDAEVEAVLEILAPRIAALPRLPESLIREKIVESRQKGYTLLLDTTYEGLGGIGISVCGALGGLVCALSIAALTPRIRERGQMLADQLRREAQLLSRTLSSRNAVESRAHKAAGGRR